MNIGPISAYLPHKILQKRIRQTAIRRVRKDLLLHGKAETDLSADDLEYLVSDAEKDVVSELQRTGLIGALALLGINLF